ncbi:MAG: efflux RND transporter periplasmic adaptor subunit [Proteobacteria bacterium]|nr:efflux RND transporter periplasmic adaptor subunit [Pseudomonadota bacterium]
MNRRRWIGAAVVGVVLLAIAGVIALRIGQKSAEAAQKPAAPMQFLQSDLVYPKPEPLARWLPVSGTLEPVNQVVVKAKVSGDVRDVLVREGETVHPGEVVARFDTSDLDARRSVAQGALESARAQLALADKTRGMNTKLLKENFISQNAYDNSQSGYDVALGNVKSAEAQVRLAEIALRDATVTAPLGGSVAKRHVQPGEKVPFDAPLVTIVDLSDLEMQALVPAGDVPELKVGMPVNLAVDGFPARTFTGRIARINPSTEAGTRSILVYIALKNADAALRGGMYANGRIALAASAPVASLPADAVRTEAGQTYVWVIDNGKLAKRVVTIGRRDETAGLVELKTVLPPNLPVLAARFENLKEGASVAVKASLGPSSTQPA